MGLHKFTTHVFSLLKFDDATDLFQFLNLFPVTEARHCYPLSQNISFACKDPFPRSHFFEHELHSFFNEGWRCFRNPRDFR